MDKNCDKCNKKDMKRKKEEMGTIWWVVYGGLKMATTLKDDEIIQCPKCNGRGWIKESEKNE